MPAWWKADTHDPVSDRSCTGLLEPSLVWAGNFFFFFAALLRSGRESQQGGYKIFYPTAGSLHPGSSGKDQKM